MKRFTGPGSVILSIHSDQSLLTERVLAQLRGSISPQCFKAYFSGVSIRTNGADGACVFTPTRHAKDSLEHIFKRDILTAVRAIHPEILDLQFCIAPRSEAPSTKPAHLSSLLDLGAFSNGNAHSSNGVHPLPVPFAHKNSALHSRTGGTSVPSMELPLSAAFKLSNFENGICNKTAYSVAHSVVENPGSEFNLVFIHGAHGLGKTHLLQGITMGLQERDASARVLYTSGEAFANAYIAALQARTLDVFRAQIRQCGALIVDDVHFIAGKLKTQEELMHSIQFLRSAGRQVVLGSHMAPKDLTKLNTGLLEIMRSGLVVHLDAPEFELRVKLLHALAARRKWTLEDDAARIIATHVEHSVGALEGALCKTLAVARAMNAKACAQLALGALRDLGHVNSGPVTLADILAASAKFYKLAADDIRSDKRQAALVHARHMAIHLAKHLTSHTTVELGRFFGNRDHTSILHAVRKISGLLKREETIREEQRLLKQSLGR